MYEEVCAHMTHALPSGVMSGAEKLTTHVDLDTTSQGRSPRLRLIGTVNKTSSFPARGILFPYPYANHYDLSDSATLVWTIGHSA